MESKDTPSIKIAKASSSSYTTTLKNLKPSTATTQRPIADMILNKV
jgi:hypothetical protein